MVYMGADSSDGLTARNSNGTDNGSKSICPSNGSGKNNGHSDNNAGASLPRISYRVGCTTSADRHFQVSIVLCCNT